MKIIKKTNENSPTLIARHTSACFRIQRKDDFAKFAKRKRYCGGIEKYESHSYGRFIKKLILKKTGEVVDIVCQHLETENKGYPKGFKDYETYTPGYKPIRR